MKPPTGKDYLRGIFEKGREVVSLLTSILEQLGGQPDPPTPVKPLISSFPQSGKKEIAANKTLKIETRTGVATLPDGTFENLSLPIPETFCQSILIDCNAEINLTLYKGNEISLSSTIFPSKLRLHSIPFDVILIKTSSITTIRLYISNVESPTIEDIPSSTNKDSFTTSSKTVTSHGTAEQLPSISIPDGYHLVIKADPDNTDNIFPGETKAKAELHHFTLQANESVELGVTNANAAWIDSDVDGEGVEIIVEQE